MAAANVGTSLSMALSVLDLCPLTEWLTCKQALVKISIVSAILRDIVTTLTKDKCAWDFGSAIRRFRKKPEVAWKRGLRALTLKMAT